MRPAPSASRWLLLVGALPADAPPRVPLRQALAALAAPARPDFDWSHTEPDTRGRATAPEE